MDEGEELEEAMESWRACESSAMLRLCRGITVGEDLFGETFLTIGEDLSEESFLTIGEDPSVENFLSVGKGPSEETFLSGVDVTFSLFSVPLVHDVSLSVAKFDGLNDTGLSKETFFSVEKGPSEETFLSGVDVTFSLFSVPLPDVSLSEAKLDAFLETLSFTN